MVKSGAEENSDVDAAANDDDDELDATANLTLKPTLQLNNMKTIKELATSAWKPLFLAGKPRQLNKDAGAGAPLPLAVVAVVDMLRRRGVCRACCCMITVFGILVSLLVLSWSSNSLVVCC